MQLGTTEFRKSLGELVLYLQIRKKKEGIMDQKILVYWFTHSLKLIIIEKPTTYINV